MSPLISPKVSPQALGVAGERYVFHQLRSAGCDVLLGGRGAGDLRVVLAGGVVIRIEVKAARRSVRGRWHFCLSKRGHTDHRACDVVVLLAVLDSGRVVAFVVPVGALPGCSAVITSHPERYAGKLAGWRSVSVAAALGVQNGR